LRFKKIERRNHMQEKKITRGICDDFAKAFKQSELYKLYSEHKDELFLGVRNNYLNLYYNCDSIAKIKYKKQKNEVTCEIDRYYIDGKHYSEKDKEKRYKVEQAEIYKQYEVIRTHSDSRGTPEKKAQSKLVLLNNGNRESNWFCIDVEYIKQFNNKKEKKAFNGRFDIIAISTKDKPHRVALIELKYGKGAIGGNSGIFEHVRDFAEFCNNGFFTSHLKQEIIAIINSQNELGISVPFKSPIEADISPTPEFYFITLDNNPEIENASTPQKIMAGYLFNDKRWGCKRSSSKSVESKFGDVTKKDNKFYATFLFSKETLKGLKIKDIIDGDYDERIMPS
jgi:hypothetical protein